MWGAAMDVGEWLKGVGLGQYEATFRAHDIDIDVLPDVSEADLEKIGLPLGARKRLMKAIANLRPAESLPTTLSPERSRPLAAPSPPRPDAERRPITVMFCDLVGSTGLAAKLDPEDWRNFVNAYLDEASKAVTGFGGHVLKRLGDGLMALFGYPQAQENDAERAVRAALAIQRALAEINAKNRSKGAPDLLARIGIESGPVVVEATGEVFGDAPNVAARVQAVAEPGSVLVTMNVQRQVAGLFVAEEQAARELKGVSEPVQLFRIVRASSGRRRGSARALTPFIGREEEMSLLVRRWESVRAGEGQLVQIVGEPGLGKSRLIEEFHARLAETPHTWVEWSASQLLQNTPLHPIAEWGRFRFGADAPAEQRLADLENTLRLVGLDPAEHAPLLAPLVDIPLPPGRTANLPPEELRRRQLSAMTAWVLAGARSQPVVLVFEDLQWADPTSLDLLRALAERGGQVPLFLIATSRPEFHPSWGMRAHHSAISLAPLKRAQVYQMVGELASRHALPKDVVDGVSERTGGVPLFVEEVTRLLLERGVEGGAQAIPPTLQQSLAARLDRLGAAREIAQIGAVLGRDFAYALLRDVAQTDETALQASLDRLADADLLLFVEGAPPQASYRFKHALIQDAAYDSLLKSRRQSLHRRAAELLRDDPERATAAPELIANHFTQAGLYDLAIEWWGKAGDQALRRSAFQEAIAHLGKAIAMTDRAAGSSSQGQKMHAAYGNALLAARGPAAPETTQAFARARESVVGDTDAAERLAADYGLWVGSLVRGELSPMRVHAETFLSDIEPRPDSPEAGVAHRAAGMTHWFAGEYREARQHLELALALFQPGRDDDLAFRFGHDAGVGAMLYLALTLWPLGDIGRAISLVGDAEARMASLAPAGSQAFGKWHVAKFELMRGDLPRVASPAAELARLTREHDLAEWRARAVFLEGLASAQNDPAGGGIEEMRRGIELLRGLNVLVDDGLIKIALAEAETRADDIDRALAILDEALATAERTGHRTFEAELNRVRGEMLMKRDPANATLAVEAFRAALTVATHQGTRSFGLRAALSLAKLYQSTTRPAEAHAILAPALEGFSPTAEMPEIAEAQALVVALAETEEVKNAAASRQRRLQLQTSLGQAMMYSRGFASDESKTAFARARTLAAGVGDASERFDAYYGLFVSSLTRGEVSLARETAESFLREAEHEARMTEAAVARRNVGAARLYQGDFIDAEANLTAALRTYDPERDRDAKFRFGVDTGAGATGYLALTSWAIGDFEPARALSEEALARADETSHAPTRAFVYHHIALYHMLRGDPEAVRRISKVIVDVGREHGMALWLAFGEVESSWARTRLGDRETEITEQRRALASFFDMGIKVVAPLFQGQLAELEAEGNDADGSLRRIDEALALANETGEHWTDALLHRIRGVILLKCDRANRAPAEEAFLAAIAIAQAQKARSFQLRAALPLAQLYQSTARPAEAHAVLGLALEGFSPTPEMPEIAEAQALLATLAETEEVKAGEAQRERRLHLQKAYGQALMWSKGFGAEEAKVAFARVGELGEATDARFVACEAQCVGKVMLGELRQAREMAEMLLREAEANDRATDAGAARRMLGVVLLYQGDLKQARSVLQRALDDYVPARDGQTQVRFGGDTEVNAAAYLALAEWLLGEVKRARYSIDRAIRRANELDSVTVVSIALFRKTVLESLRNDVSATLVTAEASLALAEQHGIKTYRDYSQVYADWARARQFDSEVAASNCRQAVAALVAQGNLASAPYFHGLLAEIEAMTRTPEAALALIDQGLGISQETSEHFCDSYLYRLRGDILLKHDPSNPRPAEDAYRTAIAIAREQSARSYTLIASLAFAKLYQSTARPAEAHAVLAPALEGFAPTAEMPEIAEAQALLGQLSNPRAG
jgi:class 3 adenylate cyclase/predicted ATPase